MLILRSTNIDRNAQPVSGYRLRLKHTVLHSFAQGFHIGRSIHDLHIREGGGLLEKGQVWAETTAVLVYLQQHVVVFKRLLPFTVWVGIQRLGGSRVKITDNGGENSLQIYTNDK